LGNAGKAPFTPGRVCLAGIANYNTSSNNCLYSSSTNAADLNFPVGFSVASGFAAPCGVGLWNGGNAIASGTYSLAGRCQNVWSTAATVTSVACYADGGSSTANVSINGGSGVLTGAITGVGGTFTSGTLNGTPTISTGGWTNWTFTADGTTKDIHCNMVVTHAKNN